MYEVGFEPIHVTDSRVPLILSRFIDADSYSQPHNSNRFCVADGVTRDLRNGEVFKYPSSFIDKVKTVIYRPQVSKLKELSDLVTSSFTSSNKTELKEVLSQINSEIKEFNNKNLKFGVDLLGKSLFGVVAAGGIIEEEKLKCFNIADSNIMLLDNLFDEIVKTKDDYTNGEIDRNTSMKNMYPNLDWNDNEYRKTFRSLYINTDLKQSFGTLNGNKEALDHINYYDFNIRYAKYILAYTDGFKEIIEDEKKRKDFFTGEALKLEKEGTLIGYKKIM